jgi:hypothetical protein
LFLNSEENLSVSPIGQEMLARNFSCIAFHVEAVSFYAKFFTCFYYEKVSNIIKCFYCMGWNSLMIFVLPITNVMPYIS